MKVAFRELLWFGACFAALSLPTLPWRAPIWAQALALYLAILFLFRLGRPSNTTSSST